MEREDLMFPYCCATNCSFRRSAALGVGGLDEKYECFLEESDVACRMNDAGHAIFQRADALSELTH